MIKIAKYLMDNYYSKYPPCQLYGQTEDMLVKALDIHKDKVIVIHENGEIKGCAVFLTLPDDVINNIDKYDIANLDVLKYLMDEEGPNIHFILIAASGADVILEGIKRAKAMNPNSISWYNPSMTKRHKYNLN
jgi:hypothetical protein